MIRFIRILLLKAFQLLRFFAITVKWTVIILLGIVVVLLLYREWRGPWEERARENFNKHFYAFEKLEHMQREDSRASFIGHPPKHSFQHSGLSQERWAKYLMLMDEANLSYMIYTKDEPKKRKVEFNEEGANDYGYVYMEYPPPKFFNSFDECEPIMPSESCFIILRKNWYLYSEKFHMEQEDAK